MILSNTTFRFTAQQNLIVIIIIVIFEMILAVC